MLSGGRCFRGVVAFGGSLLSGVVTFGGSLLSGGRCFRRVVTFGGSLLSRGRYFLWVVAFGGSLLSVVTTLCKLVRLSSFFRNKRRKFVKTVVKKRDEIRRSSFILLPRRWLFMSRPCCQWSA